MLHMLAGLALGTVAVGGVAVVWAVIDFLVWERHER